MESKSNRLLIGLICIIFGIFFMADEYFNFKMADTILIVLAGALLLLYHTKHKVWSLVAGIITCAIWIFKVLPNLGGSILLASIFMIPGIIFMILYFSKRIIAFLVTGSILTWFGIFIFFTSFMGMAGEVFFICMGMAFFTMYLINRYEMGKWPLFPAVIFIIFGILVYSGTSPFAFIFRTIPSIIPIIFIIIGFIVIIRTFFAKKQ